MIGVIVNLQVHDKKKNLLIFYCVDFWGHLSLFLGFIVLFLKLM